MTAAPRKPTIERMISSVPPPATPTQPSEEDALLFEAIDFVLEKLAAVADDGAAAALADRARTLRDTILDWVELAPSDEERDDITRKVLGLHVTLSRLQHGQR